MLKKMWKSENVEWLDIELTSYCNIFCSGCLRQQSNHIDSLKNDKTISFQNIKDWLKNENFPNIKTINFCGTIDEPTTHPELFKILKYFFNWNVHISISTNGSTRTKHFWAKFGELLKGKDHAVFFGIDGLDGLSEKYRIGSKYEKVRENYRSFIDNGGNAIWQFIVFDWNEHQLERAKDFSLNEGFSKFRVIYSHRKTSGEKKKERIGDDIIECKYWKNKRLFLNHMGDLIPCCHLNAETLEYNASNKIKTNYGHLYKESGSMLSTNLKYNTVDEVLEGDVFSNVIKSWKTKNPVQKCYKTCAQKNYDIFMDSRNK